MMTLHERVTIGDRRISIYEDDNGKRRTWKVFEHGKKIYGPASRVKCYDYINRLVTIGAPVPN